MPHSNNWFKSLASLTRDRVPRPLNQTLCFGGIVVFRWLNKQGVESDRGFSVQYTGRFTAEYREGAKKIIVDIEGGFAGEQHCVNFSKASFERWSNWPGPISAEEQRRIILNFREAIEFQGSTPIESA